MPDFQVSQQIIRKQYLNFWLIGQVNLVFNVLWSYVKEDHIKPRYVAGFKDSIHLEKLTSSIS